MIGRVVDDTPVFKALAHPTRRLLLDALYVQDGQSLSELEGRVDMTRFGVMKHLSLLEEAGLVATRRSGREKLHFLNPVPIRLIHDRWIDKYTEPWAAALSDLKHRLETTMEKVYEIYIHTTPERLWEAITDPDIRSKYNFGAGVESEWIPGAPLRMGAEGNALLGEGEVLGDSCHLTVTHDQLREGANDQLFGGWPMILSGLKTWLETGQLLTTPGSLMYG
jgi:DNA-binding transcriptional ArsR family regulator